MRGKKSTCAVCGETPSITRESIEQGKLDYAEFCGRANSVKLDEKYRMVASEFEDWRKSNNHTLLDVRESVQFNVCSLPGSKSKFG